MFSGRRLRVQAYAAPGHAICIGYASIEIDNLHPSVTYEQVSVLAGFEALTVRALKGTHPTAALLEVVRAEVLESGCSPSDIISLKLRSEASDALDGLVRLRVRFRSWDQAKVVHDFLNGRELPLMNVTFRTNLSPHFSYSITIPLQQYEVQYRQWIALRNSVQAGVSSECNLTDFEDIEPPAVRLCVSGSNEKAVGALKVRVERLATGEKLDGWHPRLKHDYSDAFVARVLEESGALVCADCKNCQLLAYGSPDAILRARGVVEVELARLADLDFTADVPLTSMQYLLAQGLSELRELLGDHNIRFDPIARSITISRGGHEARPVVSYILEYCAARRVDTAHQASNTHGLCPICFDSVSIPVRLGCGHTYCLMCLRHLISSAADSGIHPLVCLGGETRCNVAIPIPFIERYVPQHLLVRLLETTFRTYVSQHPQELRYCRTPDCEQIYRCAPQGGSRPIPVQCPACFSVVCPRCHSDAHDGSTCEGVRLLDSSADQERLLNGWIASQRGRVKKCPQCRVPIEKTEGCNHVKCRCGVDVCWRCLGIFPADAIYGHMNMAHGGHSGQEDNVVDIPLDHDEQEDLLPRPRGLFGTGPLRFMGAQNGVMPFRQVAQRARDNILHIPARLGQRRGQDQGQCVVM